MTDRIEKVFAKARSENRAAFISYVCAGDPDPELSLEVCRTLIQNGTDILEIGVPFSDPLADGLSNQLAAERALAAGMTQDKVFKLVEGIRSFSEIPIIFYTYYNLVFSIGPDAYAKRAIDSGVDGILTLDLPPEESSELDEACRKYGLKTVYIVAPTSPESRIELISRHATGFIYYVSAEGVTGERDSVATDLKERVSAIRKYTALPVVVGFGISKPEHVKTVGSVADGVVVGSALVNTIAGNLGDPKAMLASLSEKLRSLVSGLHAG